jgi:hypothetical protein
MAQNSSKWKKRERKGEDRHFRTNDFIVMVLMVSFTEKPVPNMRIPMPSKKDTVQIYIYNDKV